MSRATIIASFVLTASLTAAAQIPNASFEDWTDGQPDGWVTSNIPGFVVPVNPVSPGAAGNTALQGEVVSFFGIGAYPPLVWSFFPYDERPAALTGSYTFSPVEGDSLFIDVVLFDENFGFGVGFGAMTAGSTGPNFQAFSIPIMYFSAASPDSAFIQMAIFGQDTVHVGSKMVVDNLAFSGTAVAVEGERELPNGFVLEQNYPNPFNPSTKITYAVPAAGRVTLTVSNVLGNVVSTLVDNDRPAGAGEAYFDGSGLPSGIYYYTLRSGAFVETRPMMLLK